MLIIPAIYLSGGKVVSQYKGDGGHETVFSKDPLSSARSFEKAGANIVHLVGTDDSISNPEIAKLIAKSTELKVQYAGNVLSMEILEDLFNGGVSAVSLDQSTESLIAKSIKKFGTDKILFTIRSQRNLVEGKNGLEVFHYGKDISDLGVKTIISRDIRAEGTLHPNFDEAERLVAAVNGNAKIIAFGGIGTVKDIEIMQRTGVFGVMISRAFFEGKISFRECMAKF